MQLAIKILLLFVDGLFNWFLVEKYGQLENLDWTGLDFFFRGWFFFGGGGVGAVILFFLVCKKNRVFNLFPTGYISSFGAVRGEGGSIT